MDGTTHTTVVWVRLVGLVQPRPEMVTENRESFRAVKLVPVMRICPGRVGGGGEQAGGDWELKV